MVGVDRMGKTLRAGGDLQDDVEALAGLDRAGVGKPPPQMLYLGLMGVERGDSFRVHGTS
jgi:hypothetical protein